jgi:hypothetical protein
MLNGRGKARVEFSVHTGVNVDESRHSHADRNRLCAETRRELRHESGNPREDGEVPLVRVGGDAIFNQDLAVGSGDGCGNLSAAKIHACE